MGLSSIIQLIYDPFGLRNPYDYNGRKGKEANYQIASMFIDGPFADMLLIHYIWGKGNTLVLDENDVKNLLKPRASLTLNNEFRDEVFKKAEGSDCCAYKRAFDISPVFDENNPSGGLGNYSISFEIEVIACKRKWEAKGSAFIFDRWDFDWNWVKLKNDIQSGFANGGREIRTFSGSFIDGDPFDIKSVDIPIRQTGNDFHIIWD